MTELILSNLEKKYAHTVLQFSEWRTGPGITWIKGGNGTGKTTLFKIISGQTPFTGTVTLNHISLHTQPAAFRSLISYAEAEPQYPVFITGNELLSYYLKTRGSDSRPAAELTEAFKMAEFMPHKIESYSSGMLKKLSLICALACDVQLYLLDEPLITIDAAAAEVLYKHLDSLSNAGKIVLLSSHQEVDQNAITLQNTCIIAGKKIVQC